MEKTVISSEVLAGPVAVLVDEMLACYVDWREDADAVAYAYRRWSHAPAAEEPMWFSAYLAAIEDEEAAAASYALAVAQLAVRQRRTLLAQPPIEAPHATTCRRT